MLYINIHFHVLFHDVTIGCPTHSRPLMFVYQNQTNDHNLTKFTTDMAWCMKSMVTSQQVLNVSPLGSRHACTHTSEHQLREQVGHVVYSLRALLTLD